MADAIAPNETYTFTITSLPASVSGQKTIFRLMRMQPEVQRTLTRLSSRRRRFDNDVHQRGGRMWTSRAKATKVVQVKVGESFTLGVTPQIVPDLAGVSKHLAANAN